MTAVELTQRVETVPPRLLEQPKPPRPSSPKPEQLPPEPQMPEPLPPDLFPVPKLPDERPAMISRGFISMISGRIYVKSRSSNVEQSASCSCH